MSRKSQQEITEKRIKNGVKISSLESKRAYSTSNSSFVKDKVQKEIVELYKTNPFFIQEIATGGGKSWGTIKCINESKSRKKWLILVPEIAQIENFKKEFYNSGYEKLLESKVEDIICYASFKNYKETSLNIVLNEVQHLSDERFNILKSIKYDSILADSATIPNDIREKLNKLEDNWYIYHIPIKEAVSLGLVPKPSVYTISLDINNFNEKYEWKDSKKIKKGDAKQYYNYLTDNINFWSRKYKVEKQKWQYIKLMQLGSQRKRFISTLKTNKAQELIDKFEKEGRKYIVFCGSIDQVNKLGKKYALHSKIAPKKRKELINKFNNNEINKLFVKGMLIEGMTLSRLDTILVIQLDKGEENESLKAIQMCGRSLRSENPEMYILYIKNSMDYQYLQNTIDAIGQEFLI